jgi:hypothetical protein
LLLFLNATCLAGEAANTNLKITGLVLTRPGFESNDLYLSFSVRNYESYEAHGCSAHFMQPENYISLHIPDPLFLIQY